MNHDTRTAPSPAVPFGGADALDPATTAGARRGDVVFKGLAGGAGGLVVTLIALLAVFLVIEAAPALMKDQANFLTDRVWNLNDLAHPRFGIPDLLWVTLLSSIFALVIAVPVAMGCALVLTQYAPRRLAKVMGTLIDLLAAVPSIIYGLWGYKVLGPAIQPVRDVLESTIGRVLPIFAHTPISDGTIFLASLVLAVMVLPIITALSREVFAQTPVSHQEGALALGATRWEVIRTAVLPFGTPGVVSAAMLGLGRALGETIAIMIIVSKTNTFSFSLFSGGETFASRIANNASEFDSPTKTGAYIAAGLVLFVMTFVVNAVARMVIERRAASMR